MKNEKGFVLVTGLMLLLLITLMMVTAMGMLTSELRFASGDKVSKQIFWLAEAGLEEARSRLQGSSLNKITDTFSTDPTWSSFIGDGSRMGYDSNNSKHFLFNSLTTLNYAVQIKHKVNSSGQVLYWTGLIETPTPNRNIYVITSMGFDSNGRSKKLQIEVVPPISIPIPGTVYAKESVKVKGNSSGVKGEDECGFGGISGITTIYPPGVNVDTTGSQYVTGIPQFGQATDVDIVGLVASLRIGATVHSPENALNYGDPTKPNDLTACPNQVIYVSGNFEKGGGQGCGILVINGDWLVKGMSDGELNWYGPIIVKGDVNLGGGGNIKGVILSGGINEQSELGGNTWVRYCSTAVASLANSTAPYLTLKWVELFN